MLYRRLSVKQNNNYSARRQGCLEDIVFRLVQISVSMTCFRPRLLVDVASVVAFAVLMAIVVVVVVAAGDDVSAVT